MSGRQSKKLRKEKLSSGHALTAAGLLTGVLIPFVPASALALPQGGNVTSGVATISTPTGTSMRIDQTTDRLIVDWTRFNIAANESVRFQQPSAASIALNRVLGPEPSAIFGSLSANGQIFLINPSGILFGAGSRVDVGALTASTLNMRNQDFLAGQYRFTQDPALANAAVVNQGVITAGPGGYVALLGAATRNEGVIQAQLGSIVLAAGRAATLDMRGDGLIQFVVSDAVAGNVISPDGKPLASYVSNTGTLQADGGMVTLQAKAASDVIKSVVNQEGVVRATSLVNHGGVITLIAEGDHATVFNSGILEVSAGEPHATPGAITVHSDGAVSLGGTVTAGAGAIVLVAQDLTLQGAISTSGEMTVNAVNLTIADGSVGAASGAITVSGNVTQTGGTFAPGAATITVGGNWTHAGGSFDPGTSTVDFNDATQSSTIMGDNTFYNLTSVTPDKWLFFEAGATQTVLNNVTLQGERFHLLHLRSTDPGGVQWRIDPRGAVHVNFVFLGDALNVSPRVIKTLPSNSYGNNTGWDTDPTWNGLGADNDWTTIGNWDTGVAPIATDTVTFDATSTKNSTVNAGFAGTIGNLNINTGYTGTITLARSLTINGSYTQADGTFTAGSNALTISPTGGAGAFTLSGGTFTAPSGTLTVSDPLSYGTIFTISGGTFNHNNGTVQFTGYYVTADVPANQPFNNVTVAMNSGYLFDVANGKTLTVNGTLALNSGYLYGYSGVVDGTIDAKGSVSIGAAFQGSYYGYAGTTVLIDGAGDQSFVVPAGTTLPRMILNSGLTTISFAGSATINGDFTLQAGTFTAPSGTLTVTDATGYGTTFTINGGTFNHNNGTVQFTGYIVTADVPSSVNFNNVTVAMNSGYLFDVANGKTLTVNGTLALNSGYLYGYSGVVDGTIDAKGAMSIGAAFQGSVYGYAGTTVLIDGAGDQSFVVPAGAALPRMILNSGLTTMSFAGSATINGDFTLQAGTFTAPSATLSVTDATGYGTNFTISGGIFNHNNGTVQFTGYIVTADVPSSVNFNNVTVAMNSGYAFYVPSGKTLTVNGALTLSTGYLGGSAGVNDGTLEAKGAMLIGAAFQGSIYGYAGTTVLIDGAGDQSFVVPAGATLPRMILNSGLTTMSFAGSATINGNFTLQAGTFTAPSATLSVTDATGYGTNFTISGGIFNHNNGTVQFTGYIVTADVPSSVNFNNVTVAMNSGYAFYVPSGKTLTVNGALTLSTGYLGGSAGVNDGTLEAKGAMLIGAAFQGSIYGYAGTTVLIDGAGDQSFVVPAGATLPRMILNSGLTTMSFAGSATINGNFTLQAGTFTAPSATLSVTDATGYGTNFTISGGIFNHNNGTVQFTGYYVYADVPANQPFNNLTVALADGYPLTITVGKTLTALGTLVHADGVINTGTIAAQGNVIIGAGADGGTAVLQFTGGNAQTYTDNGGAKTTGNVTVNKTVGSAVTLATNMSYNDTGQTLTITSGSLDLAGHNLTVNSDLTVSVAGTLQLQGAETITDGSLTLSGGSTVRYNGTAASYTLKDYTYSNLTIDGGAATVFSFPANLNGINTLTLNNSITSLAGHNLTATTLVNNATLRLQGNETVTLTNGNDTAEGSWEYVGDGAGGLTSYTIKDFGATDYYNLKINSTEGSIESFSLTAPLKVVAAFTHSAGTLTAGASGIDLTAASATISAPVIATAGGNILITTDTIDLAGAGGTISGTGALTLQPATAARPMVLGAAGTASDFALSTSELAALADGFSSITIGRAADGTGPVTISPVTFTDPLTIVSGSISAGGLTDSGLAVTLTARTGDIQGSGGGPHVTAGSLTLNAITGIGSTTQLVTSGVTSGSATTSGGGAAAINIVNSAASATTLSSLGTVGANAPITFAQSGGGALTVTSATTTDGAITLSNAAAALTATTVTAGGTSRNISLTTTTSGALSAGTLTATGDSITLTGAGSIIDTGAISAGLILGQAATNVTLNGTVSVTGAGDSLVLVAGGNFINNTGASALAPGAGRWLVYSTNPALDTRGGLAYNFKQYNATYGVTVVLGTGNGFLYTIAPSITPSLIGAVTKVYDSTITATLAGGNYAVSGAIDGDTVTLNNPGSGSYDTQNVGINKNVAVSGLSIASATNGAATVYGYQLASNTANANIGTITAKALTITAQTNSKTYDSTTSAAAVPVVVGLVGSDTVTGKAETYATANVGAGKTLSVSAYTVNDGNGGNNYTVTTVDNLTGAISAVGLTVNGVLANNKIYDGTTVATLTTGAASVTPLGSDMVTLSSVGATGAFADPNVGVAKPVTVMGFTIGGADAGNYLLTQPAGLTADITAASLVVNSGLLTGNVLYLLSGPQNGGAQLLTSGILPDNIYNCLSLDREGVVCTAGAMWHDDDGSDGTVLQPAASGPAQEFAKAVPKASVLGLSPVASR